MGPLHYAEWRIRPPDSDGKEPSQSRALCVLGVLAAHAAVLTKPGTACQAIRRRLAHVHRSRGECVACSQIYKRPNHETGIYDWLPVATHGWRIWRISRAPRRSCLSARRRLAFAPSHVAVGRAGLPFLGGLALITAKVWLRTTAGSKVSFFDTGHERAYAAIRSRPSRRA
mgnify:FL=1